MKILFINGVNTSFGGSGYNALNCWLNSLSHSNVNYDVYNTVPKFGFQKKSYLLSIILLIYFLPGTLLRPFKNPFFEILYKISPFFLIGLARQVQKNKYRYFIFSHYCVFLYAFLVDRKKRIFLIQDLLYVRAKSLGFSPFFCRLIFKVELNLYSQAKYIICLSYHEQKILSKFLKSNIYLTSCIDAKKSIPIPVFEEKLNIVAISLAVLG